MVQNMTDPNIEPSAVRNKLLDIIENFGFDSADRIDNMRDRVDTEALLNILDRHIRQKYVEVMDAGELKGLSEAARDIGVWKTFDKAVDARAAIKEQYAKLQEKREKDTMSTPDLIMEAASILGEMTIKIKKSSGFQVEGGGGASVGNDFSLREALLLALKKSEESKLTMKQHLAIKALIEKAVGLWPALTSSGPCRMTCRSTCAAITSTRTRLWPTGTRRASRRRLRW